MPKDKDQPEEPYVPSAFEAQHVAEAMRKMLGSMMGQVEKMGVDVEGMAAMVPLASAMQVERKRRGVSYKEVAQALKVRQDINIKGKRGCPPEGCHGPYGYQEMIEALANESHPKRDEWMQWTGRPPDPEKFDVMEVNEALAELPSRWKMERQERAKGEGHGSTGEEA